ncbi:protein of unknown function (plasmid) [Azospirillum baldaniorum]|uniref:Uncharacterized protein n=1 Tax=Azospirillum baldaniorum TaxID=1064539 RepID=A0A9P1JV22_9PROT|nr:protein of unknown function [Azospirillum baldaniorum]
MSALNDTGTRGSTSRRWMFNQRPVIVDIFRPKKSFGLDL